MRWWGPRWLWVAEGFLATSALLLLAFKASLWVRPLGTVHVGKSTRELTPGLQVQENYRRHPEGFIRILDESWRYDGQSRTAIHSFSLKNNATVVYSDIGVRLDYASASGRTLFTHVIRVPNPLRPTESVKVISEQVRGVPPEAVEVTATVVSGTPH